MATTTMTATHGPPTARRLPFIHANFAVAPDGTRLRHDLQASCREDLRRVHLLREVYPFIGVGRSTWEQDRPRLTARPVHLGRAPFSQPQRLVFTRAATFVPPLGVGTVLCPGGDLTAAAETLGAAGITGVLLETGPRLLEAALRQNVLQALTIYARGRNPWAALSQLADAFPLPNDVRVERLGEGHLLTFDLIGGARQATAHDEFAWTPLPTRYGRPLQYTFRDPAFGREHGALVYGDISPSGGSLAPLVRIHSECWTSSQMTSRCCDCQEQLEESHRRIAADGRGIVILHNAEGRGIGRAHKTNAYRLQILHGLDTVAANEVLGLPEDGREYFSTAWVLRRLGTARIRLLTNNPDKVAAMRFSGIDVVEAVPLTGFCTSDNARYLATKAERGHCARILDPMGAATI